MPLTDPVPSSAFDVLERNVQDTDKFVNQETGTFTNRVGKEIKPIQVIEAEANAAIISLGWHLVGLFADGFTYLLQNDIAKDAAGDWYRWDGPLPKIVIAGTLPSSGANFVKIDRFAIASQVEAQGGTDNVKLMTPLRTKQAITSQVGTVGTAASRNIGTASNNISDNAGIQILIQDPRRKAVEDASGGRNTVIYDAQGNPNVMVVVPRFTYESLGLTDLQLGTGTPTAFLTNGAPRGEILIAKYLASAGGTTCSVVGGVQPLTGVNYDQAKSRCTGKGANWHLMSMHEWSAIALWSLANGTVPRGNTNHGRAHDRLLETARRADNGVPGDASGTGRTDTGKGPATWTHDHTVHGIHDLVGNIWEWQDQMLLSEGQIKTTLDNDPSVAEVNWVSHQAFYDSTSATGGAHRLNSQVINRLGAIGDSANAGNSATVGFKLLTKDAAYTPSELMRRLLIETSTANNLQGQLYMRNFGQRLPIRGGNWNHGVSAGLGALNLLYSRSYSYIDVGFRPAYFA